MSFNHQPPLILKKFIQLNIDDCNIFTIYDSEQKPVFTGKASEFFDICLENPEYCKYLKWYVTYFSADTLCISETLNYSERRNYSYERI